MEVITIEDIKRNSRIDGSEEDALLAELGNVAEEVIATHIRRSWLEVEADYNGIPVALKHAVLMLTDHYYNNRGASTGVGLSQVPFGVISLTKPYIKLG